MRPRVLIADDEHAIADMLAEFFQMEGYESRVAYDGETALRLAAAGADVVLLDVNMPGIDGFSVCRRLRKHLSCPIIFLTARIEDIDQLDGFAAGADDYVLKPFSLEVLGRRVAAHLARESRRAERAAASTRFFGNLTIDYAQRTVEVTHADGTGIAIDLTRTEFDIVALLSKRPGHVYDRDDIYERVWGWDATGDPAILREHIRRIRKKLAEAGADGERIKTVWGVGYTWNAR